MKTLIFLMITLFTINGFGQTSKQTVEWQNELLNNELLSSEEYKDKILKYDFSPIWTKTGNSSVYGFIGDDYQRLYIKILSVVKDKKNPDTYLISGKSMVKNNICDFSGTIKITKARVYKEVSADIDDEKKSQGITQQGIIFADYRFAENKTQNHSGVFEGILYSAWYRDKKGIQYDDIEIGADGFINNQFAGTWKEYKKETAKTANWGDYRIPLSGELDMGAGEFAPDQKYLKSGWQNYHDAYYGNNKKARQIEERKWWQ